MDSDNHTSIERSKLFLIIKLQNTANATSAKIATLALARMNIFVFTSQMVMNLLIVPYKIVNH